MKTDYKKPEIIPCTLSTKKYVTTAPLDRFQNIKFTKISREVSNENSSPLGFSKREREAFRGWHSFPFCQINETGHERGERRTDNVTRWESDENLSGKNWMRKTRTEQRNRVTTVSDVTRLRVPQDWHQW